MCSTGSGIGSVSLFMSNMLTSDGTKFCPLRICFFVFNDVVRVKVVSSVLCLEASKLFPVRLCFLTSATWWMDFCCVALAVQVPF